MSVADAPLGLGRENQPSMSDDEVDKLAQSVELKFAGISLEQVRVQLTELSGNPSIYADADGRYCAPRRRSASPSHRHGAPLLHERSERSVLPAIAFLVCLRFTPLASILSCRLPLRLLSHTVTPSHFVRSRAYPHVLPVSNRPVLGKCLYPSRSAVLQSQCLDQSSPGPLPDERDAPSRFSPLVVRCASFPLFSLSARACSARTCS